MLLEASFKVRRDPSIEMALFVLNNVDVPGSRFHAKIIASMDKIRIPFSELTFSFARSGGAGGQNVNKVNSKVVLHWKIDETTACSPGVVHRFKEKYGHTIVDTGEVQIVSQRHRSQMANRDDCIEKLHAMLNDVLVPPKIRRATKPKRSAVLKRLQSKKKDSEKKRLRRGDY
jgi:ribosome-associated protein